MSKVTQYINLSSGELLPFTVDTDGSYIDQDTDIESIKREINNNLTSPMFRILVLYPDETVNYEIPNSIIKSGGSYNENYQDGQRRTLSFTLYNYDGEYNPDINHLWAGTRLRLDQGLKLSSGAIAWFKKGIYIITKATPSLTTTGREVQISANDKFSLFEDATGKLESAYTIETDTDIEDVINSILLTEMGNGYVLDPQELIYNSAFKGKKTQATISKSAGDTLGSILLELGTQLSAEVFYNASGNLVYIPTNEVTMDTDKPLIYEFETAKGDINQLDFALDYSSIVNRVIVIGNSSNGGTYQAVAVNGDAQSPLCYQRIGFRTGNVINDSNITTNVLAQERAEYELRQQLIIKTTSSANVIFNPFLEVNNLIAISDSFFDLNHERFLLQSVSCSLDYSGITSISFSNLNNLKTSIEVTTGYDTQEAVANSSVKVSGAARKVSIVAGIGIKSVFLSLDPKAVSGMDAGASFYEGDTVYGFVVVDSAEYYPDSSWTYINDNVYCVASREIGTSDVSFGTFDAIQRWTTMWQATDGDYQLVASKDSSAQTSTFNLRSLNSAIQPHKQIRISGYLYSSELSFISSFGTSKIYFQNALIYTANGFDNTIVSGNGGILFIRSKYSLVGRINYTSLEMTCALKIYTADWKGLSCSLYLSKLEQDTQDSFK